MLLQTEGVVLSTTKYGESSNISKVFSKSNGLITLISSRPKKAKTKRGNYFQALNNIQFVCYISNKTNLHRVKDVSFATNYIFDTNIAINALRFFIAEFLLKVIKEEEQNLSLYAFLSNQLAVLQLRDTNTATFHIQFIGKLMEPLGIQPQIIDQTTPYFDFIEAQTCYKKPEHDLYCTTSLLEQILALKPNGEQIPKQIRTDALNVLLSYYSTQLGLNLENLKSKQVFEVVFG